MKFNFICECCINLRRIFCDTLESADCQNKQLSFLIFLTHIITVHSSLTGNGDGSKIRLGSLVLLMEMLPAEAMHHIKAH